MKGLAQKTHFWSWLAIVGASTLVLGGAYAMVQQSTRLGLDEGPLQGSIFYSQQLKDGTLDPANLSSSSKTDLSAETASFAIITDSNLHVLGSDAELNGQTPLPPKGVFDYAKANGSNTITWQPSDNARLAIRVIPVEISTLNTKGFLVIGQSLKPAEKRIAVYGQIALVAWAIMLAWVTLIYFLAGQLSNNKKSK
jgi:hypothetical protein